MPNFSPLALKLWEEIEVTDERMDVKPDDPIAISKLLPCFAQEGLIQTVDLQVYSKS